MITLVVLVWLAFQVLAVCTFFGMQTMGLTANLAITAAVVEVAIGAVVAREMYRNSY